MLSTKGVSIGDTEQLRKKIHLEVVNYSFTIEIIVGDGKEIPAECITPRILGVSEESCNFTENQSLDQENQTNHVNVSSGEQY